MSELRTNRIVPRDGLPAGSSGGIIQVVEGATPTITRETTTTSGSWVATSTVATITPTSSSNKILVLASIYAGANNTSAYTSGIYAIQRSLGGGSYSEIFAPTTTDGGGNVFGGITLNSYGGATELYGGLNVNHVDSPATTSAVSYRIAMRTMGGYGTVGVNKGTKIVLMEISG